MNLFVLATSLLALVVVAPRDVNCVSDSSGEEFASTTVGSKSLSSVNDVTDSSGDDRSLYYVQTRFDW